VSKHYHVVFKVEKN